VNARGLVGGMPGNSFFRPEQHWMLGFRPEQHWMLGCII